MIDEQHTEVDALRAAAENTLVGAWSLSPRFALIEAVSAHLCLALDDVPGPATVACHDSWSARIALDLLATHPGRDTARVTVTGICAASTAELLDRAGRRGVALVTSADAPADVLVAPRIAAAVDDVGDQLQTLRRRCVERATVVWYHLLLWPRQVTAARALFVEHGFTEGRADVVGVDTRMPGWLVASGTCA